MLSTNANFDALHDLDFKTPIYVVEFSRSGWSPTFSKICCRNPSDTSYKQLLTGISGGGSNVTPEKGTASISGYTIDVIDGAGDMLGLIASDDAQMQNVGFSIAAGYLGMAESDLIPIAVGQVSGLKHSADHTSWTFTAADPSKKLQKHIAWGATDDDPVIYQGNPINIILQILTSTGAGTNGAYDILDSTQGVGMDAAQIAVDEMESIRDTWFPGDSHALYIPVYEHTSAKTLIENEVLKVLNCYPKIDGQGRYSIIAFKPTLPAFNSGDVQSILEADIISWEIDLNFREMINEVEFKYNWYDGDFLTIEYWADGTSINLRGAGNSPLTIESKGLNILYNTAADEIAAARKSRIFARYKTPPLKLKIKTFFTKWLTEAGDIIPVTHSRIPDIVAGTVGITARDMEVIKRTVDWKRGQVTFELVETGFSDDQYAVISPSMTIVSGSSATTFTVSAADAAKFERFTTPEVSVHRSNGLYVATVTITDITGTTITVDDIGETPAAGWTARFAAWDSATAEQKKWGYISDGSYKLGAGNDDGHIITP